MFTWAAFSAQRFRHALSLSLYHTPQPSFSTYTYQKTYTNICSWSFSYSICFFLNYFSLKLTLLITSFICFHSSLSSACFILLKLIHFVQFAMSIYFGFPALMTRSQFRSGAYMHCFWISAILTCFCTTGWKRLIPLDPGMRTSSCPGSTHPLNSHSSLKKPSHSL